MRRAIRAITAAALLAAGSITTFVVAGPAHADTQICEQYGSTTIGGRYTVMNNRWGTSAEQCINVTGSGFSITRQQGVGNTSGAPVSYPAVYLGCHYTNCSPGSNLPMQVSSISSANSSIGYTYVSGATYDAAYDIWLDPSPRKDGVNAMEIMIWFNRQGSIQPIGSAIGNTTIGGRTWQVWQGSNGSNNVISYVAPSAITSWNFSVLDFINDVRNRGAITNSWYLTSIQAGFEPWIGGAGLAVTSFSATVNGGGPTTPPTTPPDHATDHSAHRRHLGLPGHLRGGLVEQRLRRQRDGRQHRQRRDQRLDARLHAPQRPGDHQLLERDALRHRRRADRPQRRLQRQHPG
nr:hypothetical protein GCM10020092_020960 [Actinoplanes digitatis]